MRKQQKQVALVLGGGGARGLAHIGVIEELLRRGYEITSIAGTSMGALVGGIYATGDMLAFKAWVEKVTRFKMFRLLDFSLGGEGLVKGDKIIDTLQEFISDMPIEHLSIPYTAVATDMITNSEIVLSRGSLFEAIRASISLPAFFTPVRRDGKVLVDGGVLNPLPVNRVTRHRGDILIAVDVNVPGEDRAEIPETAIAPAEEETNTGFAAWLKRMFSSDDDKPEAETDYNQFTLLMQSIDMMTEQMSQQVIALHHPDLVIPIPAASYSLLEYYNAEEIFQLGMNTACRVLDEYESRHRSRPWWKLW